MLKKESQEPSSQYFLQDMVQLLLVVKKKFVCSTAITCFSAEEVGGTLEFSLPP